VTQRLSGTTSSIDYRPVLDSFQTAVGEGDAEDAAGQVVEGLLAAPRVLAARCRISTFRRHTPRAA